MHKKIIISFLVLNQLVTNCFSLTCQLTKPINCFAETSELSSSIICNLNQKQILTVLNDSLLELLKDTSHHRYQTFLKLNSDILSKQNKTIDDLTKIHEELIKEFNDLDDLSLALYKLDSKIRAQFICYFFETYKINFVNGIKLEKVLDKLVKKTDGLTVRAIEMAIFSALENDGMLINLSVLNEKIEERKDMLYPKNSKEDKFKKFMIHAENYYTIILSLGLTAAMFHDLLKIYDHYKAKKENKGSKKEMLPLEDSSLFRIWPMVLPKMFKKS